MSPYLLIRLWYAKIYPSLFLHFFLVEIDYFSSLYVFVMIYKYELSGQLVLCVCVCVFVCHVDSEAKSKEIKKKLSKAVIVLCNTSNAIQDVQLIFFKLNFTLSKLMHLLIH